MERGSGLTSLLLLLLLLSSSYGKVRPLFFFPPSIATTMRLQSLRQVATRKVLWTQIEESSSSLGKT